MFGLFYVKKDFQSKKGNTLKIFNVDFNDRFRHSRNRKNGIIYKSASFYTNLFPQFIFIDVTKGKGLDESIDRSGTFWEKSEFPMKDPRDTS